MRTRRTRHLVNGCPTTDSDMANVAYVYRPVRMRQWGCPAMGSDRSSDLRCPGSIACLDEGPSRRDSEDIYAALGGTQTQPR